MKNKESAGNLAGFREETLELYLSVNALNDTQNFHTMSVKGVVNGQTIHILIDSGSTHDFLDLATVEKSGCSIKLLLQQKVITCLVSMFAKKIPGKCKILNLKHMSC